MTIRKTAPLLLVLVASGAASPVLADCCSSFWDCAATVVTEGLSCEVETIIDTIKTLMTEVTNFGNDITGITSAKEQAARQYVSNTINVMQSQSQQGAADLTAALNQAQVLYKQETVILPVTSTSMNGQGLQAAGATTISGQTKPQAAQMVKQQTAPSGPPGSMTLQSGQTAVSAAASNNSTLQKNSIAATVAGGASMVPAEAAHGAFADAFARGVKQLTAMKSAGDIDMSKVNQYLTQAQNSEGPGVAAADTIAGAMTSPISAIESQMTAMLTHPWDAFDPSSLVDDMEKTITTGMSSNIQKMIDDITVGPQQQFSAAQPTFDDLLQNAEGAQQLAFAMTNLYKLRTTAAANALYALLPKVDYAGLTSKATTRTVAGGFGKRQSYAVITASNAAAKQKLLAVPALPSLAKVHTLVAQYKQQRAQGKTPLSQALMVNYRSNLSSQLNGYFTGKSAAAIASQRDQLIAQARTQYATDPTTQNGVIALLNSEAAKRGAGATATATVAPIPGQPVPTLASQASVGARPQVGTVAPVNPGLKTTAPTWGAAPAWTPPGAAGATATTTPASSTFKTTTTLKTTPQQQAPPSSLQTAPTSLGR